MKKIFLWTTALALAVTVTSPIETRALTNGVILITTRNDQDISYGGGEVFDQKGPGNTAPGDTAMVEILGDYGYSCRLLPDLEVLNNSSVYFNLLDPNFGVSLMILSGSSSSSAVPPSPTNDVPVMMGEHSDLGDNAGKPGSVFMYYGTQSNDPNESSFPGGATKYMKVIAPNHPIMQGIPLDADGRVRIFREAYPEENAHVPALRKPNYEYRWCTQNANSNAPGTVVLGVLAGSTATDDTNRACLAVVDVGGILSNGQPSGARLVHMFMNEDGNGGARRVFNALTAIGRVIFIRSVKWALGEPLTPYQGLGIIDIGQVGTSQLRLSWAPISNKNYRIEGTTDFLNWTPIADSITHGVDPLKVTRTLDIAQGPSAVFMRVAALP